CASTTVVAGASYYFDYW
nr:immunoglobulin heavy chain junction region [Mus musculus]NSM04895.1 immunoglobulin heavy chain junction region [Mus musculus]NSM06633.1 immunoglobulin heavy chain junction region [Mus musculus]